MSTSQTASRSTVANGNSRQSLFPKTLEAARQIREAEGSLWSRLWDLGDALVEECGAPGEHGVNTGSNELLKNAAMMLHQEGLDYSFRYLELLRTTAAAFPDRRRLRSVPWHVHLEAGDPDTLDKIGKDAERQGKKLTVRYVKDAVKRREDQGHGPEPRPDPAHVLAKLEALRAAGKARDLADHFQDHTEPYIAKLLRIEIEALAKEADAVAADWTERAVALRKHIGSSFAQAAE